MKEDYDEVLLKELEKRLQKPKNQQLIVLHIQGSHGPSYYKRYPQEFERFKPTCQTNQLEKCSQESLVNTYDNTLLYTDFILSKIIALLKQKQDYQSALFYISDHGESLGENGIYLHGMPYPLAPKEQTHVLMMFWSNDGQLMKKLDGKKDLEFSHDNIFHTILGYFKVKTPLYDSTLDLLSN
ncbi:phosphoethanolamine transferase [Helicobacter pullorum]|uniref:phosphoethanolamine transferase n=1 Tax=Helicobacter pullorum TaxID=35818 RepID=UPI000816A042|nr:sulfatase-like hydrolase/transferase [Helicobacter pullorum]OCR11142.1 hypothetical protein A7X13_00600 [Helicobacter pullorum]